MTKLPKMAKIVIVNQSSLVILAESVTDMRKLVVSYFQTNGRQKLLKNDMLQTLT